jgi:hypothetical protein
MFIHTHLGCVLLSNQLLHLSGEVVDTSLDGTRGARLIV